MNQGIVRLQLIPRNARLVDARKERYKNADEFAEAVGIKRWRLRFIETLKVVPTEDEICRCSIHLTKQPDYLFPDELLSAIDHGVFSKRMAELSSPQLKELTTVKQHWLLTDGGLDEVEERLDAESLRYRLEKVFTTLTPREVKVLKLRFGLEGKPAMNLDDVGKEFDVTRERIRQIEGKALRKLRHPSRSRFIAGKSTEEPRVSEEDASRKQRMVRKQTTCDVCGEVVGSRKGQHIMREHPEYHITSSIVDEYWRTYILYHCGFCDFHNPSPAKLVKHIEEAHPKVLE